MTNFLLKKGLSGTFHQYFATVITLIFSSLTSILLIKFLTITDFGIFNFFISLAATAQFFTSLGLVPTIQRYLPEFNKKDRSGHEKRLISISLFLRFIAAMCFIIGILIFSDYIIASVNLPAYTKFYFIIISVIILLVSESQLLGDAILVSLLQNKEWNISRSLYFLVKFVLFFLVLQLGYGITGVIISWMLSELFLILVYLFFLRMYFSQIFLTVDHFTDFQYKRIFNYSLFLSFAQTTNFFKDQASDIILIGFFLSAYDIGLYSFAFGIPIMIMNLCPGSKLRPVIVTIFSKMDIQDIKEKRLANLFEFINKITFFIMLPIFVFSILLSDKIIALVFNEQYLIVNSLFILSLSLVFIQQFVYSYTPILLILEKTKIIFISSIFYIYNILINLFLIPHFGILGAIIGTGSTGILIVIFYHFYFKIKKPVELRYPLRAFAKFFINVSIAGIFIFFSREFINDITTLVGVSLIGGFLYLTLCKLNKGFDEKDRILINTAIGKEIFIF